MARKAYKIPTSIDANWLDLEIAIRSDTGIGLKPLPLRFIFAVLVAALLWFWIIRVTPIANMPIPFIIAFSIAWLLMSVLLVRMDKTGTLMLSRLPILISYMPKSNRYVYTRTSDSAGPFASIANIKSIDEDRGMIHFDDGDVGYVYRVIGSGSILLFDDDRNAILDRVDAFYRMMKTDYEIIYITAKEAQNVKRQVRNMDIRLSRLENDDPELYALAKMERTFLTDWVGGEFRSIHQYMILKASSPESLMVAKNMLRAEVENSTLMIKRCVALYDDELHDLLKSVFKGKESQ